MNAANKPLEAHTGEDYTVIMFPEQGTEDASFHVYGDRAKANAERVALVWNATLDIKDPAAEIARLRSHVSKLVAWKTQVCDIVDPNGEGLSMEDLRARLARVTELEEREGVLTLACERARDTFRDMEMGSRAIGRDLSAKALGIAYEGMCAALATTRP